MPDKKNQVILVVEDDAATSEIIHLCLQSSGYLFRHAEDGQEGIDVARREKPDLIIMDLMMPHVDGFTAAAQLASDAETRGIPILVMTAKGGMKDACEMSPNIVDFMLKPFDPGKLRTRVKDILSGKIKRPELRKETAVKTVPVEKEASQSVPTPTPPAATKQEKAADAPAKPPEPTKDADAAANGAMVKKEHPAREAGRDHRGGAADKVRPEGAKAPPQPSEEKPAPAAVPMSELLAQRRAKLLKYRETGLNPFPTRYDVSAQAAQLLQRHEALGPEASSDELVSVAGRLMTRRDMGKACFAHVQDRTGKIQIYMRKDDLGEAFTFFRDHVDLGDIVGFAGTPFRTKTGEITVRVASWRLLAKALRPPPEKFHGMTDVEERYRRREVDLFSNEDARKRFLHRRSIVSTLRRVLEAKGFMEVETPMMQPVPGGAAARPFTTHHEALNMQLYLRIAPELYLKRLLVGGFERVFEIGRAFRNEGIDTRHNPEFTILEAYQAYTDYKGMMDLVEEVIRAAAVQVRGGTEDMVFEYRGQKLNMADPFLRLNLPELFKRILELDYYELCRSNGWRDACKSLGLSASDKMPDHKCFEAILDERILPKVGEAAFVYGYPSAFSPLAKQNADHPEVAERFELFLCGEEVANAYSEQNDPDVQRKHFEAQAAARKAGDVEAMPADEEFLAALEHGMPPAGGLGIGVDRLTMILSGTESIREVILFPLLRPS